MDGRLRYAVASCHVERPLDDAVWRAFEELLARRPGGLVVTPLLRPPAADAHESEDIWLERARRAAELAPLGHHTHWGGPTQARPTAGVDAAGVVRAEAEWFRDRGLAPQYFCGGGWYIDEPLAETLSGLGYVDCTATTFRQSYLRADAPRLQLPGPRRLRLESGATLLALPATHSIGMLGRGFHRLPAAVHVHFHDWELLQRPRRRVILALLAVLGRRRPPLSVAQLAERVAAAPETPWAEATIGP